MCFFEIGDGKGTLLQFDYDHPPRPPKPNQLWHLGKIVFNKTYWHTVPKGRGDVTTQSGAPVSAVIDARGLSHVGAMALTERAVARLGDGRHSNSSRPIRGATTWSYGAARRVIACSAGRRTAWWTTSSCVGDASGRLATTAGGRTMRVLLAIDGSEPSAIGIALVGDDDLAAAHDRDRRDRPAG